MVGANTPYKGVVKIKNPNTLKRWLENGWYQERIDEGLIFASGCGRFRDHVCECSNCKTGNPVLDKVIRHYELKLKLNDFVGED